MEVVGLVFEVRTTGHSVHQTCLPLNVYLYGHMKDVVCQGELQTRGELVGVSWTAFLQYGTIMTAYR